MGDSTGRRRCSSGRRVRHGGCGLLRTLPVTLFGQRRRPGLPRHRQGTRGPVRARRAPESRRVPVPPRAPGRRVRPDRSGSPRRRSSSRCREPAVRPPSPDPRVPRPSRGSGTRCSLHLRGGPGASRAYAPPRRPAGSRPLCRGRRRAGHGVHLLVVVPGPGVRFQRHGAGGRRGRGRRSRTGADRPMSRRPGQGGREEGGPAGSVGGPGRCGGGGGVRVEDGRPRRVVRTDRDAVQECGTTATGQRAWWSRAWVTEPSCVQSRVSRVRRPTTTREAWADSRTSSAAGRPAVTVWTS